MKFLRGSILAIVTFSFTLSVPAMEKKFIAVSKTSKELKRAAARLRLPVAQVKNARHALQEATDLAKRMDPYPLDQIHNLANSWLRLNRSKADTIIEGFLKNLRIQAFEPMDIQHYQRLTSTAHMLVGLMAEDDDEYSLSFIQNWPDPPASFGEAAQTFRKNMETQMKRDILSRMIHSNPEKALELLTSFESSEMQNPSEAMTVVQMMMGAGMKEEGLTLIDQTINRFAHSYPDQNSLLNFENFIRMMASQMDSDRISAAIDQLLEQLNNNEPSGCNGKLNMGEMSMDLTCTESTILNLLPNLGMRPELVQRTIASVPGLESKLNAVGGIDSFFLRGRHGADPVKFTHKRNSSGRSYVNTSGRSALESSSKLLQELKGKAESNPAYVRGRLLELVEEPTDIDRLIRLAGMAAFQDAELGALALDIARQLLPEIESTQKRSSILQEMIRIHRRIEGEHDIELLRNGYILADQMREEQSHQSAATSGVNPSGYGRTTPADQLEIFLISEFSRDSFKSAIHYIHSMDSDAIKLASLIRIVQVLSHPNY